MGVCTRCYKITPDPCRNDTETLDCPNLVRRPAFTGPDATGPSPTQWQLRELLVLLRSRKAITVLDRENLIRIIERILKREKQ